MDRLLNQFRRIYSDNGSGDIDFTDKEEELRQSQLRLTKHTMELIRAAQNLNSAALRASPSTKFQH